MSSDSGGVFHSCDWGREIRIGEATRNEIRYQGFCLGEICSCRRGWKFCSMSSAMPVSSASRNITSLPTTSERIAAKGIPEPMLVRPVGLTGGADQPVGLDQYMPAIGLRPERKTDDDEGQAKQRANHHHATVGGSIGIMERRDHDCFL